MKYPLYREADPACKVELVMAWNPGRIGHWEDVQGNK